MRARDTVKRNRFYHCLEYDHDQSGELGLVACGMERCDGGVTYGPDLRDCWHLHAVSSGTGTLHAGGQTFHPGPNQLFLLKHAETVSYTADQNDPWNYCWMTYQGTLARQLSEQIGFTSGVYVLDSAVEAKAFFDLVSRMQEYPEMNRISDLRRRGILLEYLSLAMEATETPTQRMERRMEYDPQVYVQRAVDFIHYNYATITVGDVTDFIGFSRSYFSTLFRRCKGVSLQAYLLDYRMQQARRLLTDTGLSVQEIAQRVGYPDPLHFSRAFRRTAGVSPTEYRANNTPKGALQP